MRSVTFVLAFMFLAFSASGQQNSQAVIEKSGRDDVSVQDLKRQIQKLEEKMTAMQKRIDALESRSYARIPVPKYSQSPQDQMPPGARPFQFNGVQVWHLPVKPDNNQDVKK
jgi:hypothetical protein